LITLGYHDYYIFVVALILLPSHKFVCLLYCYHRLLEIKNYKLEFTFSGIIYIPNFIKILPAFLELKHVSGQLDRHNHPFRHCQWMYQICVNYV
jgi:hypothetical protein